MKCSAYKCTIQQRNQNTNTNTQRVCDSSSWASLYWFYTYIYYFERFLCYTCCCFFLFECVFEAKKKRSSYTSLSVFSMLYFGLIARQFFLFYSHTGEWITLHTYTCILFKMRRETEKRTKGRNERKKEGKAKRMTETTEKIQKILTQKRIHTNTHKGTHTHLLTLTHQLRLAKTKITQPVRAECV